MTKRGSKKPPRKPRRKVQRPASTHSRNPLVPARVYEWADAYEEGELPEDARIKPGRRYTVREILPWLTSRGDFTVLCGMIKANPDLLVHPVVWRTVQHLREGILKGSDSVSEQASVTLLQLIEHWVRGMLPGYSLKSPLKPRGPKVDVGELQWQDRLVKDYEHLLAALRKDKVMRNSRENDEAWHKRLEKVLLKVYNDWIPPAAPTSRRRKVKPGPSDPLDFVIPDFHKPPTPSEIEAWLNDPNVALGIDVYRDYLAYHLLGHQYNLRHTQVRGRIQEHRKRNHGQ